MLDRWLQPFRTLCEFEEATVASRIYVRLLALVDVLYPNRAKNERQELSEAFSKAFSFITSKFDQ